MNDTLVPFSHESAGVRIDVLDTGRFRLDGGGVFGLVPKTLWSRTHPPDELNRIELAARALLVRTGGRAFLIDAGVGEWRDERTARNFAIDHAGRTLGAALAEAGVEESAITDIAPSHLHWDHAGGYLRRNAESALELRFPDGRVWLHPKHWKHAQKPTPRDGAAFDADMVAALAALHGDRPDRIAFVESGKEVASGLRFEIFNGHTPGCLHAAVRAGEKTFFLLIDMLLFPEGVHPAYGASFDCFPLVMLREKRRLLARARSEQWTLISTHDPANVAFRIGGKGAKFELAPEN